MPSRLREPFGKAGLIVAIVALVAALAGGAYAANATDSGKRNKRGNAGAAQAKKYSKIFSKRFSKVFSQRFAVAGPAGPQGPAGTNGSDGAKGDKGSKGDTGDTGKTGADGEDGACSVAIPACVLPPGATETGMWALGTSNGPSIVPLSFNLPLAEEPTALHYVNTDGKEVIAGFEHVDPVNCDGSAAEPTAPEGEVCVYAASESRASGEPFLESGFPGYIPGSPFSKLFTSGSSFFFSLKSGEDLAWGTWAVTGN